MREIMEMLKILVELVGLLFLSGGCVYVWTYGKNLADNKTKKVCDLCFRDIKRWHNEVENYKKEHGELLNPERKD